MASPAEQTLFLLADDINKGNLQQALSRSVDGDGINAKGTGLSSMFRQEEYSGRTDVESFLQGLINQQASIAADPTTIRRDGDTFRAQVTVQQDFTRRSDSLLLDGQRGALEVKMEGDKIRSIAYVPDEETKPMLHVIRSRIQETNKQLRQSIEDFEAGKKGEVPGSG